MLRTHTDPRSMADNYDEYIYNKMRNALEVIDDGGPCGINYQIMTPDADGKYTPDYRSLIGNAGTEQAEYLRSVEARGMRFAYNMVYISEGQIDRWHSPVGGLDVTLAE